MKTITLNDGTVVNGNILDNGDGIIIFVYLFGLSLAEGFALFSDTNKTSRIIANEYDVETVYEGYTNISAINTEFGNCNLVMRKPV